MLSRFLLTATLSLGSFCVFTSSVKGQSDVPLTDPYFYIGNPADSGKHRMNQIPGNQISDDYSLRELENRCRQGREGFCNRAEQRKKNPLNGDIIELNEFKRRGEHLRKQELERKK